MALDLLGREIALNDYVVFHNNIYQVVEAPRATMKNKAIEVRILLVKRSKSTKPVLKYSRDMCIINKDDVLMWILKDGL